MSGWFTITPNKVLAFALLCVAVTTAFVIFMVVKLTNILAAPDWCSRAINSERLQQVRSESTIGTCSDLLLKQVGSLALNSHIFVGIIALCLLVLIVIVVAGGKLDFSGGKDGVTVRVERDDAALAAKETAEAAAEKAEEFGA